MNVHRGLAHRANQLLRRLDEIEPANGGASPEANVKRLQEVTRQIAQLQQQNGNRDAALTAMTPANGRNGVVPLPRELTWRARRLLFRGRDLLEHLKSLATEFVAINPEDPEPIAVAYRDTVAMTETALRGVQCFPDPACEQLPLCDGIEAMLDVIADRAASLQAMIDRRMADAGRIECLAQWLAGLVNSRPVIWKPIEELAEALAEQAAKGIPLRFVQGDVDRSEHWVAAHSLNVAGVIARLTRTDLDWRHLAVNPIQAALVFDAGMAALSPDILSQTTPLNDEQRRQIESHAAHSAEALKHLLPGEGWLVDAVRAHHERLDGTGYPAGAKGAQIPKLARLLSVCDVYAALANPRPYRPALSPRAALTETLLEADRGRLDPACAEMLIELSFYPVGTMVECNDGQIGIVAATNFVPGDPAGPARPVLRILIDADGKPQTGDRHVNLAQCQSLHVVRSLSKEEGRTLAGCRHWEVL